MTETPDVETVCGGDRHGLSETRADPVWRAPVSAAPLLAHAVAQEEAATQPRVVGIRGYKWHGRYTPNADLAAAEHSSARAAMALDAGA